MSVRIEAIKRLENEAQHGGIFLRRGGGKKARKQLIQAEMSLARAREKVFLNKYAKAFRLWTLGGSGFEENSLESQFAEQLGQAVVSELGIDVLTGAGPGFMGGIGRGLAKAKDEARKNGKEIHSRNLGIGLQVGWEEKRQLDLFDYYRNHPELLTRVQELIDLSHAAYVGPGAVGTNLELWALIQLKQMGHLEPSFALIVHPSWKESIDAFHRQWYEERLARGEKPTIKNEDDLQLTYSDDIPEIVSHIAKSYEIWDKRIKQHVRRGHFWNRKI